MMAEKARLFGDEASRARIMATNNPLTMKKLGRGVTGFNQEIWEREQMHIVTAANYAKFSQNPALREHLLATGEATIVEASPLDRIWGIGLSAGHPDARTPARWRGRNLLGQALMLAREQIAAAAIL